MQTVKDWIFKALYKTKDLTKYSIILAIYLLSHCDQNGRITIHHADMERIMDVDSKVFYANLHRLLNTNVQYKISEDKIIKTPLIIRENTKFKGDICLKIPYNDFDNIEGEDNPFANFVKVDYTWLKCAVLKRLSHAEIRVLLYLFFRAFKSGDTSNTIDFNSKFTAYRAIAKQLDISTQTVRKAIYKIKNNEYIKVNCEDEQPMQSLAAPKSKVHFSFCACFMSKIINIVTTSKKDIFGNHEQEETTEKHFRSDRHIVRNILRKRGKNGKYIAPEQDINDIAQLINMYRTRTKGKIVKILDKVISGCSLIRAALVHQKVLAEFKSLGI